MSLTTAKYVGCMSSGLCGAARYLKATNISALTDASIRCEQIILGLDTPCTPAGLPNQAIVYIRIVLRQK